MRSSDTSALVERWVSTTIGATCLESTVVAMMLPRTRYASSGDCCIAYQVIGHGSIDLVFVPGISGLAILSNGYFGGV